MSYIAGTDVLAANMRCSSPSAVTTPPSVRSNRAASICSNSAPEHSPRSSAWTGFWLASGP